MAGRMGMGDRRIDWDKLMKSTRYLESRLRIRESIDNRLAGVVDAARTAGCTRWAATAPLYDLIDWLHSKS